MNPLLYQLGAEGSGVIKDSAPSHSGLEEGRLIHMHLTGGARSVHTFV